MSVTSVIPSHGTKCTNPACDRGYHTTADCDTVTAAEIGALTFDAPAADSILEPLSEGSLVGRYNRLGYPAWVAQQDGSTRMMALQNPNMDPAEFNKAVKSELGRKDPWYKTEAALIASEHPATTTDTLYRLSEEHGGAGLNRRVLRHQNVTPALAGDIEERATNAVIDYEARAEAHPDPENKASLLGLAHIEAGVAADAAQVLAHHDPVIWQRIADENRATAERLAAHKLVTS